MNVNEFLIAEEATMLQAMEQLDTAARKVLFVVKENRLIAAITDGDIRRWILNKGNLDAKVKDIANYQPHALFEGQESRAKEYMISNTLEALPILDSNRRIINILFWNDGKREPRHNLHLPVVIMAGGLGKRLYPYTKILPKPLIPIGEIPIVEHIMNRFNHNGSNLFYLVVNHKKNMIKAYFNEITKNYQIEYIDEHKPLGTGGGLSLLKGKIQSTFILSNCDILIEEDFEKIYEHHVRENNIVTMVCSLKKIRIPYGVIEFDESGTIRKMQEKPELSFFTNTGVYIVEPKILEELEEDQFIGFPDIIEKFMSRGEKIGVYPISENSWLDMGQIDEMEEMRRRLEKDE